jgi:hypothetical protein
MRLFFTGSSLATINKVRLYLRVVTLSDIISSDGRTYDKDIIQGKRGNDNPSPSVRRYQWPPVPAPTRPERDMWTHGIQLAFDIILSIQHTKPLMQPTWYRCTREYTRWLFSPTTQEIYEFIQVSTWQRWTRNRANVRLQT